MEWSYLFTRSACEKESNKHAPKIVLALFSSLAWLIHQTTGNVCPNEACGLVIGLDPKI
jgi:hypothetical protein